uniref:Coiled-coil SMC6 And NSE5 INteracting (CANIN) domain-containing protein n=1 Tax=Phytophthora ramorum TaxID=164328 RepID=H3GWV1_PHYRM
MARATATRTRTRAAKAPAAEKKRRRAPSDSSSDDEQELELSDTRRGRGKRQKASAILTEFTSLDALLSNDLAEKRKRQNRERKLQKLREESEAAARDASEGGSSPLGKLMSHMASNMSTLSGDSHLFLGSEVTVAEEKFGYVFTPITEPLPYRTYKATETELKSDLKLVYAVMQSTDDAELSGLLCNLFLMLSSVNKASIPRLSAALPVACFAHPIEDFRSAFGTQVPAIEMEWKPTIYDFLNAFRAYGFQDSKRSMSVKSKIPATPPSTKKLRVLPFPTLNMHYVLMYLVICLRTKTLTLEGYDAFSFTMFFLRMQFENDIHASIVDLATICIEELLDVFPRAEWRREWAPQLVLRIAGANEGLFDSAAGWLAVARRLPRTMRGTQLTTGLSIYVLQHRIDIKLLEGATSERPLKFPIQSGLVVDIVAGIVQDLTLKYAETRKNGKLSKTTPPFDLLCKKVALMDLALQAFLNILTPKEMKIMLNKLDQLADAHKSTMSAKWHELKTLVSLMHRKYSLENLRIGRSSAPSAKTELFCDDDDE